MNLWQVSSPGAAPICISGPVPAPGAGEIRVRIHACGLNFADLLMLEGRYQERPEYPYVPGLEMAGVVDALGAGVAGPPVGTPVAAYGGQGGLAEYVCVPAERVVVTPAGIDPVLAAGFLIAYGTSHVALAHRAGLRAGETLLVTGAAGGVGLTAVEIGHLLGARVIAAARGPVRLEVARAAGADILINTDATPDLKAALKALGGVDVVYDPVGGPNFDAALRASRPEGRLLTIGFASGEVPQIPANLLLVKNLTVMGLYWGGYLSFRPEVLADSLATLFGWWAEGRLFPHVSHVLPFDRLPEGLDLLRRRAATGKVVITIA